MSNQLAIAEKQAQDLLNKEWGVLKKYSRTTDNMALEITRTATLAIMESPKLQDALKTEKGQISFVHSMKLALRTGISLNPQEGKAALIPYGGEIKYQIMKNGMVEIAMASPNVKMLSAKVVFENDKFKLWEDENGCHYTFEPALSNRGKALGYVAIIVFKDGGVSSEYMSVEQVREHKKKYVKYDSDAWKNSEDGMGKKTVIKLLLRNVSVSSEVSEAVGIDDSLTPDIQSNEKTELEKINEKIKAKKEGAIDVECTTVDDSVEKDLTDSERAQILIDEAGGKK